MLKEFLWETFKKTGNIEAYMGYKEIEEMDDTHETSVDLNHAQKELEIATG